MYLLLPNIVIKVGMFCVATLLQVDVEQMVKWWQEIGKPCLAENALTEHRLASYDLPRAPVCDYSGGMDSHATTFRGSLPSFKGSHLTWYCSMILCTYSLAFAPSTLFCDATPHLVVRLPCMMCFKWTKWCGFSLQAFSRVMLGSALTNSKLLPFFIKCRCINQSFCCLKKVPALKIGIVVLVTVYCLITVGVKKCS